MVLRILLTHEDIHDVNILYGTDSQVAQVALSELASGSEGMLQVVRAV